MTLKEIVCILKVTATWAILTHEERVSLVVDVVRHVGLKKETA